MTSQAKTPEEIAAQLAPVIRQYAASSESQRRMAPEIVSAMVDAGVMRSMQPQAYGGLGMDPVTALKLIEELSYLDSATGWTTVLCGLIATFVSLMPEAAAEETIADPKTVVAGALFPPGSAEVVQGGYKVSGHWNFASGSNYATWMTAQVVVMENGAMKLGPTGMPDAVIVLFNANDAKVIENWDTLGMRGTGSNDVEVHEVFIPEHRAWHLQPWIPVNPKYNSEFFRMGPTLIPPAQALVTLGIARAAIDDLVALAGAKVPNYTQTALADKPVVQDRLARARAVVDAARAYVYSTVSDAVETLRTTPKLSIEQGMPLALAGSFGIEASVQAVDLVQSCVGTSGIRNERRFQQYFRDVHTLNQHAFSSPSRFESIGKLMLGKESDWPFYYI